MDVDFAAVVEFFDNRSANPIQQGLPYTIYDSVRIGEARQLWEGYPK